MTITENSSPRSRLIGLMLVILIIAAVVVVWLIKNSVTDNGIMRQITYQVEASGGYAQIIYTNSEGVNIDTGITTTPFQRTISFPVGVKVFLTASNPSQTGEVLCKIKIDNKEWKESRASHPVDSVACGGIIR